MPKGGGGYSGSWIPAGIAAGWMASRKYKKNKMQMHASRKNYVTKRRYTGSRRLKRRWGRKRRRSYKSAQPGFKKKANTMMQKLKRRSEAGLGTFTHKRRDTDTVNCSDNQIAYQAFEVSSTTKIEDVIDSLPVFDPATPGTYILTDFTSGTNQKDVEIVRTFAKLCLRNNRTTDTVVTIYVVCPKFDTSISPVTAITNGLSDVGSGLGGTTSMLTPNDSPQFRQAYKILKSKRQILSSGDTMVMTHVIGSFVYDPSLTDSHTSTFQQRNGAFHFLVRIEGTLCHANATATNMGTCQGRVDYMTDVKTVVKYEAGANIEYIEVDNNTEVMIAAEQAFITDHVKEQFG